MIIFTKNEKIDWLKKAFKRQHSHLQNFIGKGGIACLRVEFDSFLLAEGPERTHHEFIR